MTAGSLSRCRKCSRRLAALLESMPREENLIVWIFFTDHGKAGGDGDAGPVAGTVSARAHRRMQLRSSSGRVSPPLPRVAREYVDGIRPSVQRIRRISRYFNAVSAEIARDQVDVLCALPFVARLDEVKRYRYAPGPVIECRTEGRGPAEGAQRYSGRYGGSLVQLELMQAVELLEMGYNGSGTVGGGGPVLVCVMDTGFDRRHEALDHVNVIAEWDFVEDDSITWNEEGDTLTQDRHGTSVLGTIAGYRERALVGPAWGAGFLLAKTEIISREIRAEEDNWVAGIEWADSSGADIVSSSIGYIAWYEPDSLDGETALCTRAASIAASRGIVVVNSAGNFGYAGLIAPADADSIITVGAVDRYGNIAGFSSRGPTADGRTKPDLVAMGVGVYTVRYETTAEYTQVSGTSFSAPLVAGLCAILLEIHPEWTPAEVKEALLQTASRRNQIDNAYGYGIPRGFDASGLEPPAFPESALFTRGYPNPFHEKVRFELFLPERETVTVKVFDARGALVRTLVSGQPVKWGWTLTWDGTNDENRTVAQGVYFVLFQSATMRQMRKVIRLH